MQVSFKKKHSQHKNVLCNIPNYINSINHIKIKHCVIFFACPLISAIVLDRQTDRGLDAMQLPSHLHIHTPTHNVPQSPAPYKNKTEMRSHSVVHLPWPFAIESRVAPFGSGFSRVNVVRFCVCILMLHTILHSIA